MLNAAREPLLFVEDRLWPRAVRDGARHPAREKREPYDVEGRLKDMDRMGVHAQVLFPAFFIRYNTTNPEAEAALAKSYNRWLAGRCAHSNGRLRWAAVLPFLDTDDTVDELRWAKAHGACGFFKRGFDLYKQVSDPHFFPVYEGSSRPGGSPAVGRRRQDHHGRRPQDPRDQRPRVLRPGKRLTPARC